MKVCDLVRVKKDIDLQFGVGIVVEVKKHTSRVKVSWVSESETEWTEKVHLEVISGIRRSG